jgi:putative FmdB family regulatory protein
MPTYDYVCLKCEEEFEVSQSMRDDPLERCILNGCDGPVKRRISAGTGLIFKGSGFYATDYKKNGKSEKSEAPACPAAKDDAKCESCPASKAAAS